MLSVRVENEFLCATLALKKWFAGLLLPKIANWLSKRVNHAKYYFTHACLQNWESISPTISEKIGCYFFYFFLLFLLSPLFFPSQLIRKTLSVTKTQSGRHNIYGWREGWYRALPPLYPVKKKTSPKFTICTFYLSLCVISRAVPHPAAPIMYSFRSVIPLSL